MNIAKSMVRLYNIEAEEYKTRIKMKGVQLEVSECKYSVEKFSAGMNTTESNFNEWHSERKDLKKKIDNLKKANDERVKEIEKLEREKKGLWPEVSGCKKSLEHLLERINTNESNLYELCKEKSHLKNDLSSNINGTLLHVRDTFAGMPWKTTKETFSTYSSDHRGRLHSNFFAGQESQHLPLEEAEYCTLQNSF